MAPSWSNLDSRKDYPPASQLCCTFSSIALMLSALECMHSRLGFRWLTMGSPRIYCVPFFFLLRTPSIQSRYIAHGIPNRYPSAAPCTKEASQAEPFQVQAASVCHECSDLALAHDMYIAPERHFVRHLSRRPKLTTLVFSSVPFSASVPSFLLVMPDREGG